MHTAEGRRADIFGWFSKTFLQSTERKLVTLGVSGVLLSLVSGMAIFATAIPWIGTTDSAQHLDYAWQVSHGKMPNFWKGTQAPLGKPKAKIQFVSHHPPLYYAVVAPFTKQFIDSGHWVAATAVSRVISIGIGMFCAVALAWGGWVVGGKRRAILAIATPAIGTSLLAFYVAGDIMNDGLAMLFSTLAIILSILIIRRGVTAKYSFWLAAICLAGMATKASFIGTVLVVFVGLIAGAMLHGKGKWLQRLLPAIKAIGLICLVVAIGIGWFYVNNYKLSGSPFRNRPPGSAQRFSTPGEYETLSQVLTSGDTWSLVTTGLYGRPWQILPRVAGQAINFWPSLLVVLLVSYGVAATTWKSRKKIDPIKWITIGILALQFVVTYILQIMYSVGYGGVNRRYLLPAWLSFSLFMAIGILYYKRLRGLGVILIAVLGWISICTSAMSILVRQFNVDMANMWRVLSAGIVDKNGLPPILPLLIIGLIAGLIVQGIALWQLTGRGDLSATNKNVTG